MLYTIRKILQYGIWHALRIGTTRVIRHGVWIAHLCFFWIKFFSGRIHCYTFQDIAWRVPQDWAGAYAASEQSRACTLMNMEHQFDILGSGWISWNRSKNDAELCMRNNDDLQFSLVSVPFWFRSSAKELIKICGAHYSPINWCRDPIGNYTWSARRVYLSQPTRSSLEAVGGHCIAVDPWFIVARDVENAKLIRTAREVNNHKTGWVIDKIKIAAADATAISGKKPTIACLGLAFKPDIDDLRESPALHVAQALKSQGYDVIAVEPNIDSHDSFTVVGLEQALEGADVIAVLVKHRQFLLPVVQQQLDSKDALDFCGALRPA